jgi:hypothetical protein
MPVHHGSPSVDIATGAQYTLLKNASGSELGTLANPLRNTPVGIANVQVTDSEGNPLGVSVGAVAGAFATGQASIADTATLIAAANANRLRLVIVMHGTTDVYVGASGLSTATGQLLKGVAGNQLVIKHNQAVYGIVASGSQTVSYLEESSS